MQLVSEDVRAPTLKLAALEKRRTQITDVLKNYQDVALTGTPLNLAVSELAKIVSPAGPGGKRAVEKKTVLAVKETVIAAVSGRPLSEALSRELTFRLAGNVEALCAGVYAPQWQYQTCPEWVAAVVAEANECRTVSGKYGANLSFLVINGGPAGATFQQFLSEHALHILGFSCGVRARYADSKLYAKDFVQMKVFGRLAVGESLKFTSFAVKGALVKGNKRLNAARDPETRVCPQGHRTVYCRNCPVGYVDCGLAVHRETYTQKRCRVCGKEGWVAPGGAKNTCIRCQHRQQMRG